MKIALLGDLGFFGKYSLKNNKNLFKYFEEVSKLLKIYDIVIGNLETPFIEPNFSEFGIKSAYLGTDKENVKLLQYLNIGIVNISNNHIFDYGRDGYKNTLKILDEYKIKYFGNNQTLYLDEYEEKIALTGWCCYSTNGLGYSNNSTGIQALDGKKLERELLKNKRNGYLNIASIHCGEEHINYPNYDHILLGRKISEKVEYIYYGHHPHVLQGVEEKNGSLLAYSLGNFCFDDIYDKTKKIFKLKQNENNKETMVLSLEIRDGKLLKYEFIPIVHLEDGIKVGDKKILEKIKKYSNMLKLEENEYRNLRKNKLDKYYKKRKTLKWYIKKINLKSMLLLYSSKKNKIKYNEVIKKYIL